MIKKNRAWYALFVLPLVFVFTTVVIIPFITGIGYAFISWNGMHLSEKTFVGLRNFIRLFSDKRFLTSAYHTVIFAVSSVAVINIAGLSFALMVTSKLRVSNLSRAMLFMPYLIGGIILGYIWQFIFMDIFKTVGQMINAESIFFNWLIDKKFAILSLILVTAWQNAGYVMIIYINGIQSISDSVVEAAKVDGAGFWHTLFRIKLPLLMPAFTVCLFITLSNCFKIFDVNVSLTGGGPNNATEMMALNIYNEIFSLNNYGYGQAKAILFFIAIAAVTLAQVYITKKREVEM